MAPQELVQLQLDAYNRHDLEGFLATYSETVKIYRMPALEPSLAGKEQVGSHYAANRFNLPGLRAEVLNRMVLGNKVVDHERVWGVGPEASEVVVIYEVVQDKIEQVWFFRPV